MEQERRSLEDMQRQLRNAEETLRVLLRRRELRQTELVRPIFELLRSEFQEPLNKLNDEISSLKIQIQDEQNRKALENVDLPFPEGTTMVWWGWRGGFRNSQLCVDSTRKGKISVIRPDSPHPGQTPDWARARVGEVVVRLLKQDGTLGKRYERVLRVLVHMSGMPGWYPLGVNAEELRKEKAEKRKREEEAAQQREMSEMIEALYQGNPNPNAA